MIRSLLSLAFAVALVSLASCTEFSSYCGKKIDCEGGNDKDKAACADQNEGAEDEASAYGCSTQFGALQTCKEDGASCVMGQYRAGAACDRVSKDLETCMDAASGRKH